ncbi:MAG: serine hydroxymethyltransferase [Pseudomonadota bacterium]|nr:serine hydroxymethyltransferase [Pseudomonadota bacterium]
MTQTRDSLIFSLLERELHRQQNNLVLIASENYTSLEVMRAQGSVATNKYAEGYPGKRFYAGCEVLDEVENLAIERVKKLFGVEFANVQPHSGSQANAAVFMALLNPGDTILGLNLSDGGHLTHGSKVNMSGHYYHAMSYHLDQQSEALDYDAIEKQALDCKPKIIIAGYSAYALEIDWQRFRAIADKVGAYLLADISHVSGMVVAGVFSSPVPFADVVTSTTHKSLRGPRGGMILTPRDEQIAKKIDSAIFPGLQGGPMMHAIAAKAVSFWEAMQPGFVEYQNQVLANARAMVSQFQHHGFHVVSGKTDSHLFLVDLTNRNQTGKQAEKLLESIHIVVNKNTVPGDKRSPFVTSGFRVGALGLTTRGLKEIECTKLVDIMVAHLNAPEDASLTDILQKKVINLCESFPIYSDYHEI